MSGQTWLSGNKFIICIIKKLQSSIYMQPKVVRILEHHQQESCPTLVVRLVENVSQFLDKSNLKDGIPFFWSTGENDESRFCCLGNIVPPFVVNYYMKIVCCGTWTECPSRKSFPICFFFWCKEKVWLVSTSQGCKPDIYRNLERQIRGHWSRKKERGRGRKF